MKPYPLTIEGVRKAWRAGTLENAEPDARAAVRYYLRLWSNACARIEAGGYEPDARARHLAADHLLVWGLSISLPYDPETIVARDAACDRIMNERNPS